MKPDPIFELIEAHREAWARYVELNEAPETPADPPPDLAALLHKLDQSADAAMDKLMETAPATLAGAAAVIRYFIKIDDDFTRERSGEYLLALIRSPVFAGTEGQE